MEQTLIQKDKRQDKQASTQCYHCGEACDKSIDSDDKYFCCEGCKFVYQLLRENGLCNYYDLSIQPGIKIKGKFSSERFAYLDNEDVKRKLLRFDDGKQSHVSFYLPQMHCASCIWLLENLHSIDAGIYYSKTNFHRKDIFVAFDPSKTSLRKIVELLAFVGYEPYISLKDGEQKRSRKVNRSKIFKIGVAGFCFSNIMMLSFPEYFSSGNIEQQSLKNVFSYLNLALSLPVLFYSASGFFISARKGLRQKWLNIDAPIALAVLVAFGRSAYEILSGTGPGYLDSMSGIVFFMLIGRWFQDKTYDSFSFDRDYKSYFPLGVTVLKDGIEETAMISTLKKGDPILVRQNEMIPADAVIKKGEGNIDYSFVSGENIPLQKSRGELVYAGGKQLGGSIEMEVVNPVEQSYITQLWNNTTSDDEKNKDRSFVHPWSRYFTLVLFAIAGCAVIYWALNDPARIWPAVTATLLVACPCSLLLSSTFTFGNMLRHFGKSKFYLKNSSVIEALAKINTIVFDKTGTLTHSSQAIVSYVGKGLTANEVSFVYSLAKESIHPLSRVIKNELLQNKNAQPLPVKDFKEIPGKGIIGAVNDQLIKMGSWQFVNDETATEFSDSGMVFISINDQFKGVFKITNQYRSGINEMIRHLARKKYDLHVLSGDNDSERVNLQKIFGKRATIKFQQSPQDKLDYINRLKRNDCDAEILMLGDGLNDAGALKLANVGIAVSENSSQFSPASDAIMDSSVVNKLFGFISYAKAGQWIVMWSFIISILYNVVGLSFAVQAKLSPLIAAILMPVSSITIVSFVTLTSAYLAKKKGI